MVQSRSRFGAVNAGCVGAGSGAANSFDRQVAAVCEAERPRLAALFGDPDYQKNIELQLQLRRDPNNVQVIERELMLQRESEHGVPRPELRPRDGDGGGRRDGDDQDDPPGALLAGPTPARSAPAPSDDRAAPSPDGPARRRQGPDLLMGGHVAGDKPEDSIVCAMLAALNGIRVSGEDMAGRAKGGHPATLGEIAGLMAWHKSTVHRSVKRLIAAGAVVAAENGPGYLVVPEVHATRWAQGRKLKLLRSDFERLAAHQQPARRDRLARRRAVAPAAADEPDETMPTANARTLLLVGLLRAHPQVVASGAINMGLTRWSEYSGMTRRTLQREIQDAEAAGLLRRRTTPYSVVLAPMVPSPVGALCNRAQPSPVGALCRRNPPSPVGAPPSPVGAGESPVGAPPSPVGARKKGVQRDQRDSPSEALPRPAGETESTKAAPAEHPVVPGPVPAPPRPVADLSTASPARPVKLDPIAEVERWAIAMAKAGIERMEPKHWPHVAGLLDLIGSDDDIRDRAAVRANRRELANLTIAWCPSPGQLAQWLLTADRERGVESLAGYLRKSVKNGGDPGTLLRSHMRNKYGQGADQFQHFTSATDTALEGPHATAVAVLMAEGSAAMCLDLADREKMVEQVRRNLAVGRKAEARKVLLQLVGPDRSDEAVLAAVGDAELALRCSQLLRGVA